ncbi:coleoptile phototropism protein 1-like [Typha angustifolia]|uniref:coleoptile phototropism protein 1-like n=1 Tax=Typha angustifolia TaxID=59011 RepID=UPI003C2D5FA6
MRSPSRSPKSPISSVKPLSPSPKPKPAMPPEPSWLDESSIHEMDHFARTLSGIKSKGIRPDHLASVLSHYASHWLPELAASTSARFSDTNNNNSSSTHTPESPTATWLKKRFYVESLVAALPPEKEGGVACDFLLRLLRTGSMVGADAKCLRELEARAGRMLDGATLGDVMIPGFSHTCGTLLDVGLALRLVRRFFLAEQEQERGGGGGAAAAKVARLVDGYLAEAAVDAALGIGEFEELARAVPAHARATDDGIYRAVDTYIKAHPNTTKQERKTLSRLIDARKLTAEASLHAIQNDRLPVRSVIQVLFSEHNKLNRLTDWSGSFTGARSPSPALDHLSGARCPSKRAESFAHHQELRRLRDDVARLQVRCNALQVQVDRLNSEKRRRGLFRWSSFLFGGADVVKVDDSENGAERRTPVSLKKGKSTASHGMATPPKWRNSLS